ncbi:hypothetical protein EXU30_09355 [Shewanella maritima]|uniref:Uncharacterized protein n=1 Tax=Shewanella maritima TaxID=2520507 RepID=A0A411PHP3_9GAMM|nr:hypothetical protein [Shewanella maritima]QBF82880.1 hypothetical protein EXU30_09355 [Shewanella maritima]
MLNPHGFYHALMHKQLLTSTTPPSIEAMRQALLAIKQTAYAQAQDNVQRYRKALSHFITDLRILLLSASTSELKQFDELIQSFISIHDNEANLTDVRLYKLSLHQMSYYYYQALLREQKATPSCELENLIAKYTELAQQQQIKLHHESEHGRERLLNKLHLGRKVIHSPYKVSSKMLKNGQVAEQLIFGVAAALAMAFATAVAFATQKIFGNFSTPFFFSLVLSYIFKDRIKELGRQYLLQQFSSKYFQHHFRLYQGNSKHLIVDVKESFFRQSSRKLPKALQAVLKHRPLNEFSDKAHWVYQRRYFFSTYKRKQKTEKFTDELTINLSKSLRALPKILSNHHFYDAKQIKMIPVHKTHYLYLLISQVNDGNPEYAHFRVSASRKGIHGVNRLDTNKTN